MPSETIPEKLKKILNVSVRIKMEQMRNMLDLDQKTFDKKLLDWANEHNWIIDGDYIIVKKESVQNTQPIETKLPSPRLDVNSEASQKYESFRGVKIPELEVKALQELEIITNKKFILSNSLGWFISKNVFKTKDQHVSGISLDSGCSKIVNLPESIRDLTALEEFRLVGGGKLASFPQCLTDVKALFALELTGTPLETIPESIGELKSLYRLELNDNNLISLSASIGQLKSLHTLELHNNNLETLPESIGNLRALATLGLKKNKLKELPDSILNLKSLEYLLIDGKLENTTEARTKNIIEVLKGRGVRFEMHNYTPMSTF